MIASQIFLEFLMKLLNFHGFGLDLGLLTSLLSAVVLALRFLQRL